MQTVLSVASSLNMDYLNDFEGWEESTRNDLRVFDGLIQYSKVREEMSRLGYEMIAFETGYNPTNIHDADIFLSVEDVIHASDRIVLNVNEFEDLLIKSTFAGILYNPTIIERFFSNIIIEDPYSRHRNRIRFTFSKLAEVPARQGHYFIFAHIIIPHPPFVFDENGAPINPDDAFTLADASNYSGGRDEYIQRYRQQLIYLNSLLKDTVNQILASSEPDPIIILQADHGPGAFLETNSMADSNLTERLAIFNAYYLPSTRQDALYPSITPVNSFRLILNEYFGFPFHLLEDKSYFATWRRPFKFIDVTDELIK